MAKGVDTDIDIDTDVELIYTYIVSADTKDWKRGHNIDRLTYVQHILHPHAHQV